MVNDQNLLIELKNKSEAAWVGLQQLYAGTLLAFCMRHIEDRQVAEDVTNDIIRKTWEQAPDLDNMDLLKAYLFNAVRNACFNELKKDGTRKRAYKGLKPTLDILESEDAAAAEFRRSEFMHKVKLEIRKLPEQERKAFLLWRAVGYDRAIEISGTKKRTLYNQVNAAKRKLLAALGPCRYWDNDNN
jgi:RNA polymerase sigma factor (sigma-70 family)